MKGPSGLVQRPGRVSGECAMQEGLGRPGNGVTLHMAPHAQPHWEGAAQRANLSAPSHVLISQGVDRRGQESQKRSISGAEASGLREASL